MSSFRRASATAYMSSSEPSCDVLILGASLLGVELVYRLRRSSRTRGLRLCVVDRQTEHAYIPLIQERITDRITPADSVLATKAYVESVSGDRFVHGEMVGLDVDRRAVALADGRELSGRIIVVALGSVVRPPAFLSEGPPAMSVKFGSQLDAARERIDVLVARGRGGPAGLGPRIVVVGGGISGVELAGELAVLRNRDPAPAFELTLVQGASRLLPGLTPRAGARAAHILEHQGVDLRTDTRLTRAHAEGLTLVDRSGGVSQTLEMETDLVLWAGGLEPAPVLAELDLPTTEQGWLRVGPTLQPFPGEPAPRGAIFAGGDAVRIFGGEGEWPTMQRAIEAIWQAKTMARNIALLAAAAEDDPDGPPPLSPHRTWWDFAHGVSLGARSLVVWGRLVLDLGGINVAFRRWLMRQYMRRYRPR